MVRMRAPAVSTCSPSASASVGIRVTQSGKGSAKTGRTDAACRPTSTGARRASADVGDEPALRVDPRPVDVDLEVQVRAVREPGVAHLADDRCETERLVYLLARQARRIGVDLSDETVTVLQEVMEGRPRTRVV